MSLKKRIWQGMVRGAFQTMQAVPRPIATVAAASLGQVGYRCVRRYHRVAEKNLRIAYGDSLSAAERETLIQGVYRHFSRALVDFLKAPRLTPEQTKHLVQVDSFAPAHQILARGKGMILVTAHLGNWELLARRAALEGFDITVVARQSHDSGFNVITDQLRESGGYHVHPRGDSPRVLLRQLRHNKIVAILPDQKSEDVFVPFFGQVTGTVAGPAVLALKTGAPILPMFCPRRPDGTYQAIFLPEIDITATDDHNADISRIMYDINLAIESVIRQYPEQWLWLHDRWKVLPPPGYVWTPPEKGQLSYEASSTAR